MSKIKLCPKCGSDWITRRQYFAPRRYEIICDQCGNCVEGVDKSDALTAWNRRAKPGKEKP